MPRRHVPAARAGTMFRCDVHQLVHEPSTVSDASASHPVTWNVLFTMRVPGLSARNLGASLSRLLGSRNSASTVAFEISASYMSPSMNVARSATPASCAFRRERATISGLNSKPKARAPRLAAAMTLRPSPDPRSITMSCGVTFAMSSIFSTSSCGVGTQTTSLPAWPGVGSYVAVCAAASAAARTVRSSESARERRDGIFGQHEGSNYTGNSACRQIFPELRVNVRRVSVRPSPVRSFRAVFCGSAAGTRRPARRDLPAQAAS